MKSKIFPLTWNYVGIKDEKKKNIKSQIIMGIGLKGKTKLYSRFRNVKKYEEKLSFLFLCCLVFSPWVCNDRNSVEWGEFWDVFFLNRWNGESEWMAFWIRSTRMVCHIKSPKKYELWRRRNAGAIKESENWCTQWILICFD